jgi:hypothetical protein
MLVGARKELLAKDQALADFFLREEEIQGL